MPKKQKKITAWSYSRLSLYGQCPLKFKLQNIDKLPQPKAPAMQRGIDIHKLGEDYLNGKINRVPDEYKQFSKELKQLRKDGGCAEEKWAFNKDWEPLESFFDAEVWNRMITDAHVEVDEQTIKVIDFKTGRVYDSYEDQMMLFATGTFSVYESIKRVETELWFLDQGKKITASFNISELAYFIKHWKKKVGPMFKDKKFSATANQYCKWCHYRKSNGGPCKLGY